MSAFDVVVLVASALAGAVANAKQSGKLPASWVPYVTFVGTFALAFGASMVQSGALSAASLAAAALAGVYAVVSAVVGVTAHQHFTAGKAGAQ